MKHNYLILKQMVSLSATSSHLYRTTRIITILLVFATFLKFAQGAPVQYTLSLTSVEDGTVQDVNSRQDFSFSLATPTTLTINSNVKFFNQTCNATGKGSPIGILCYGESYATILLDISSVYDTSATYYTEISNTGYTLGGDGLLHKTGYTMDVDGALNRTTEPYLNCDGTMQNISAPCEVTLAAGEHNLHMALQDQFGSTNSAVAAGVYTESITTTIDGIPDSIGPSPITSPEPASLLLSLGASLLIGGAWRTKSLPLRGGGDGA